MSPSGHPARRTGVRMGHSQQMLPPTSAEGPLPCQESVWILRVGTQSGVILPGSRAGRPTRRQWPTPGCGGAIPHSGSCAGYGAVRSVPDDPLRRGPGAMGPACRTLPVRSPDAPGTLPGRPGPAGSSGRAPDARGRGRRRSRSAGNCPQRRWKSRSGRANGYGRCLRPRPPEPTATGQAGPDGGTRRTGLDQSGHTSGGTREGVPSCPPASSRERIVHRIDDLHRETGGVCGWVCRQSPERRRIGRGSDGRSHGVEDVVVGHVPRSEFAPNLDKITRDRWEDALQQREPFCNSGGRLLAMPQRFAFRECPEADLRVDLSDHALCLPAPS